jgi:hypothetical protein
MNRSDWPKVNKSLRLISVINFQDVGRGQRLELISGGEVTNPPINQIRSRVGLIPVMMSTRTFLIVNWYRVDSENFN